MTVKEEKTFFAERAGNDCGIILRAEVEGCIVGLCGLDIPEFQRNHHRAEFGMTVQKGYWRQGIGRYLVAPYLPESLICLRPLDLDNVITQPSRSR